jgi:hypothetical protein
MRRLVLAAVLLLAACASAPRYVPAASSTGAGYSEMQVENNRYFVTYRSASSADPQLLQDFALLRAADVTLEAGRDWFWVDRRQTDAAASRGYSGPSIGVGVGGGSGHFGGGVGLSFPIGGGGQPAARARSATLEIRFGQGVKPDDPNAYDARALSAALRSRLLTQ